MKFETVLDSLCLVKRKQSLNWTTISLTRKSIVFYAWLLRHDEKQREEIAELSALLADAKLNALLDQAETTRLQAQVATLERIIEREAEKTAKAGQP